MSAPERASEDAPERAPEGERASPRRAAANTSGASPTRFEGFGPAVTDWFLALESDNSRAFWVATRDVWRRDVRLPLEALFEELAAESGARVKLFRPQRDMRFASGRGPLKPQAGGLLRLPGSIASRYAEVSLEGFYAGSGVYRFERDQLERYREAVSDEQRGGTLQRLIAAGSEAGLEAGGDALVTAPRGVPRDHPHIVLLRRKGLFLGASMPPGSELETRAPLGHSRRVWAAATEVVGWLDRHVGPSELERV